MTTDSIRLSGTLLSRAWMNVILATEPDNDDHWAFYRTLAVEHYPEQGVRLYATDTHILLRSWVPALDHLDTPEPDPDEAPDSVWVGQDVDWRARAFMKHIRAATRKDDDPDIPMTLLVTDSWESDDGQLTLGAEFESRALIIGSDQEHVALRLYEAGYPSWRTIGLQGAKVPRNTATIGARQLSKLAALQFVGDVEMTFTDKLLILLAAAGYDAWAKDTHLCDGPSIAGAMVRQRALDEPRDEAKETD
jgi:hypothetical protein